MIFALAAGLGMQDESWKRLLAINYNAASLRATGRSQEISEEFSSAVVIALTGTRNHWFQEEARRLNTREHIIVDWGYAHSVFSNKACGVQLRVRKRGHQHHHIMEILPSPRQIQGRVGGIRLKRGMIRMLVLVAYAPPKGTQANLYSKICLEILAWLDAMVTQHGRSHLVLLMGDVNVDFGLRMDIGEFDEEMSELIGREAPARENSFANAFRNRAGKYNLMATLTHFKTGPT